jgi:hypothetical protein
MHSLQFPLMALQGRLGRGKAGRLCLRSSDVDLFGYRESVIDLNAEVAHRALDPMPAGHRIDYLPHRTMSRLTLASHEFDANGT